MRGLLMRSAVAGALIAGAVACGDDEHVAQSDAPVAVDATATIDAAPVDDPFSAFVIAMIEDRTSDVTDAEAFATFSELEDDDADNDAAYASLFE